MKPFGWFYEMVGHAGDFNAPRDGVYLGSNAKSVTDAVAADEKATSFPLYEGLRDAQKNNLLGLQIWHQSKADEIDGKIKSQDAQFISVSLMQKWVQDQYFHDAAARVLKEILE